MSAALAAALAFASIVAQDEPAPAPAGPGTRPQIELDRELTPREIGAALAELASAHPDLLRVASIGNSRGGEELWVVTLAPAGDVAPDERPAVLFVAGLGERDFAATDVALRSLVSVADQASLGGEAASALERTTLYVAPCLNPDLRARVLAERSGAPVEAAAPPPARVDFDRNFPSGWDPIARGGSGGYPLSEPETRALAEFLLGHPAIAVVECGGRERTPSADEDAGRPDVAAHRALAGEGPLAALFDLGESGGTALRFAWAETGAFAFSNALASGAAGLPTDVLRERGEANARATLALLAALPRIGIGAPAVEALAEGTWKVDLSLVNEGALPTASRIARERGLVAAPRLTLAGARVLAAAARRAGDAHGHEPIAVAAGGAVDLAEIGAGAALELRLVVAAEAGAVLDLAIRAPRASGSTARIELR